jgi:hypothetical protein
MFRSALLAVVQLMSLNVVVGRADAETVLDGSIVLFRISGSQSIRGGRFGSLADFQQHLLPLAKKCGLTIANDARFADGTFGSQTALVIAKLTVCPDFGASLAATDPARGGAVSSGFWRIVAPDVAVPDAIYRAHTMTLSYESTDYVDIEFNTGTTDSGILTWGPLGATAGQAQQVQAILLLVDQRLAHLIDQSFGSEAQAIRLFANTRKTSSLESQVAEVKASPGRSAAWRSGFEALGANRDVRDIYDTVMGDKGTSGIFEGIADFYCSYWSKGWKPTEIDYAFFFDRAVQMDVRQEKTNTAATAVQDAESRLKRSLTAAERRRAISANFTAGAQWAEDRLARDVAYYIDGIPAASLSNTSLSALRDPSATGPVVKDEAVHWAARSGKRASDFGLSDDRLSPPPAGMAAARTKCIAP